MQNQGLALHAKRRSCVVTVTSGEKVALGSTSQAPGDLITRLLNQVAPGTSGVGIVVRVGVLVMAMLCAGTAAGAPTKPPPEVRPFITKADALLKKVDDIGRGGLAEGIGRHLEHPRVKAMLGETAQAILCFWLEGIGTMVQTAADVVINRTGWEGVKRNTGPLLRSLADVDVDVQMLWKQHCEDKPPGNSAHAAWITAYNVTFPDQVHRSAMSRAQLLAASQRLSAGLYPGHGVAPTVESSKEAALLTLTLILMTTPIIGDEALPVGLLLGAAP